MRLGCTLKVVCLLLRSIFFLLNNYSYSLISLLNNQIIVHYRFKCTMLILPLVTSKSTIFSTQSSIYSDGAEGRFRFGWIPLQSPKESISVLEVCLFIDSRL